jgi:hypothetical protein
MNTYQRESKGRVISITSARRAGAPHSVLALTLGAPTMDLAEVARSLQSDRNLCYRVTEAACQEFGWTWLSLEEAILLLGRQRLCALLSNPDQRGRSARQLRRALYRNHTAPAANPRRSENFQGKT